MTKLRTELQRGDLTGKGMDIIVNVFEVTPGETVPRHTHPGEEIVYVLEGGTLELPDGERLAFPAGTTMIYPRGVPHAGVKVVGEKTLKMINVFVVDKGKPVTELAD
jgi:quercetin dioxygenase-like cupin family protein